MLILKVVLFVAEVTVSDVNLTTDGGVAKGKDVLTNFNKADTANIPRAG